MRNGDGFQLHRWRKHVEPGEWSSVLEHRKSLNGCRWVDSLLEFPVRVGQRLHAFGREPNRGMAERRQGHGCLAGLQQLLRWNRAGPVSGGLAYVWGGERLDTAEWQPEQ